MVKLNASYSKKVPAQGEYSSQSYHASVEVELSDGLTPEQLQGRIHDTFSLVRQSVEAELGSSSPEAKPQKVDYASTKQLKYLLDLAGSKGITPQQLAIKVDLPDLKQITRQQCSKLIDELNGKG